MAIQVQFRRGNKDQNDAFTGALAEVTVDTTQNTLRVHDGIEEGGYTVVNTTTEQTLENKTLDSAVLISSELLSPDIQNPEFFGEVTGDLIPSANVAFDLGSASNAWKNLFLSGSTIFIGSGTISFDPSTGFEFLDNENNVASISLEDTGVIPDTYGSSSEIPVITIDADGRISSANVVSVAGVTDFSYDSSLGKLTITTADNLTFDATIDLQAFETSSVQFGEVDIDNLNINGSTISATSTNGSIILSPNGNGVIDANSSKIINVSDPISPSSAATKSYVDSVAQGLNVIDSAFVLVDEPLSATYDPDGNEIGWATLTSTSNGAFPEIDDVPSEELNVEGTRILITAQANAAHNGIYVVKTIGDESNPWVLRRCQQCYLSSQIPTSFVFVEVGTVYGNTGWVATVPDPLDFTVGEDDINFAQFSGAGTFTAGTGLSLNGSEFSVNSSLTHVTEIGTLTTGVWNASTIAVNRGGTGQTSYTNGQLLIGNSTGNTLTKTTLTAGSNVTITNGPGSISIAAGNTNLGITAGTTAGPIVTSSTGTNATLPTASASASGVITTAAQTLAGNKTFNNNVRVASFGVNTDASGTAGEIRATNNITAFFSDERLKTNLGNIENALEKIDTLSGFYFEPNKTAEDLGYEVKRDVGVSAQKVQSILPEAVVPAPIDEKYLTVRYEKLVPLLIEGMKEQQRQIEKQNQQIEDLVSRLYKLETK